MIDRHLPSAEYRMNPADPDEDAQLDDSELDKAGEVDGIDGDAEDEMEDDEHADDEDEDDEAGEDDEDDDESISLETPQIIADAKPGAREKTP